MTTETTAGRDKITLLQEMLLYALYALIALMVVFSILAVRNLGQDGYHRCVTQKCEARGQEFCSKNRELANCCAGAGGELSLNQLSDDLSRAVCRFD